MALYNYHAVNKEGKEVRGKISAANPLDLEEKIKELDFDLIDYTQEKAKRKSFGGKIKPKDMIMFCVHIEELDRAGVPIIDSLVDIRDTVENDKMRDLLSDLVQHIKSGDRISTALKKRPDVFDELFVGLIAAGEDTGDIGSAFGHLSNHIKWNTEFRRKIKKAITYPIVLVLVMAAVITMMMLFVVPQLVDFLQKQGFELPFYTKALIATAQFFESYWWIVIFGIPITFIIALFVYKKNEAVRSIVDGFLLRVPGVGPVILKINLARFVKFFSITFNSGLGVLESLRISEKVVTNRVLKQSVGVIAKNISEGTPLTTAIADTGTFPSLVVRMFKVGEESGNMERTLSNVNFFYEREIDDSVDAMVGMIQPTLLIVLGSTLMWIIAAVFGPVYGSFSQMKF